MAFQNGAELVTTTRASAPALAYVPSQRPQHLPHTHIPILPQSVSVFLIILTSGLQYIVLHMNYKRDLVRIERISKDARLAAWGPKLIPVDGQRKVKVNLGGNMSRDEDGNVVNRGRLIDMVVDQDGSVFFVSPISNRWNGMFTVSAGCRRWFPRPTRRVLCYAALCRTHMGRLHDSGRLHQVHRPQA